MSLFKKLLGRNNANQGIVALNFSADGIAVAISRINESQKPTLLHSEFISTHNKNSVLKELTEKFQLHQYDCYLVLASDDYRLITMDAPAVAENEVSEAIRWKISELIDFDINDAVIDYYHLPDMQRANSEKMLEIIATSKSTIQPLVDMCISNNLQLKVIDIMETTLRNLATLLPENDRGIAVLHLEKKSGRILIQQQGKIYLNRKLGMGFERLGLTSSLMSEEQISLEYNALALEIQRSFDYVENYYGMSSITSLAVIPIPEKTQEFLNSLNSKHGITARVMDLSAIIDGDILLDDQTQSFCTSVIGATLRNNQEFV